MAEAREWQAWFLPCSKTPHEGPLDFVADWYSDAHDGELAQFGMVCRREGGAPEIPGIPEALDLLIRRLIRGFHELAHGESGDDDYTGAGVSRRSWALARQIWLEPELGEPRMSLIVRLAQDRRLHEVLDIVSRQPRQVLARVREETRMDRIRELDASCLRDYARRPGLTAIQKAGARQTLLAIQRVPNRDTLENRTATWVMDRLGIRSRDWGHEHRAAAASTRALAVARLGRAAAVWRGREPMQGVSTRSLSHPVQPNYPLQMDDRYREVMRTYRLLYQEQKTEDEAWIWRRVLWSQAARQMLACVLWRKDAPEAHFPYYLHEQDRGRWLASGASPGPFLTSHGIAHWVDAAETQNMDWLRHAPRPWMREIGKTGCEAFLWWPGRQGGEERAMLLWPMLWTGDSQELGSLTESAADALDAFTTRLGQTVQLTGLVLTAHVGSGVEVTASKKSQTRSHAVGIHLPMSFDQGDERAFRMICRDFDAGLKQALEDAHG